jgi:palmitoyl-protein thioesterase
VEHWGAPTDYFRTWWNLDRYYETSTFLPYVNNELEPTAEYKDRILSLTNMGLFMWDDDEVVHPKESEWFGIYNQFREIVPLRHTELYKNDTIGLKTLDEQGKLFFYHGPGLHMHLAYRFIDDYLVPLLLDETPSPS